MSVSSRTKVHVVAQLVQLLLPAEPSLQNLLSRALQQVFFASNADLMRRLSEEFRGKCVRLLTAGLKTTAMKSVVVDLVDVMSGRMQEGMFERKYCQV